MDPNNQNYQSNHNNHINPSNQNHERRPEDDSKQLPFLLTSPAPFLRPAMAGGGPRSGSAPRQPRLGLAIPPSPNQKPVNHPSLAPDLAPHQGVPQNGPVPRSRPTPPSLRLATPLGSHITPTDQSLPQVNRPVMVPQITTGSLGSDGSARSRADSFTVVDSRGSNPTSASSGFSGQRHLAGTPDPASAISSVYSEVGAMIEQENNHPPLPDLSKLSLEKGHALEPEDLDNDGWKAANEQKQIEELGSLGEGAGGAVTRCRLRGGKKEFALKLLTADPNPEMKKQLYRELNFNRECKSEYICKYYGFYDDSTGATGLAMEYCAGGSLHSVYQEVKRLGGRTGERVLGKIAEGVLHGLTYLHSHKIIHRDIKPGNILLTREGQVRLCDFGVSGQSGTKGDASTFIGTSYYMAPERITGQSYTITSDVWSLGVTLLEVAQHRFPFPADGTEIQPKSGLIDLLTYIVGQEIPKLKDEPPDANGEGGITWSPNFKYFIECCLEKENSRRGTPWRMLDHPWMTEMKSKRVNVALFLAQVWDWKD